MTDGDIGIVIVDDHRMFAESLARLLSDEQGLQVLGIATDGAEAVSLTEALQPRVVIVDYQMPGQDGVELTVQIRAANPHIMVLMLTGSVDDHVLLAAIEAGVSGFLTKDGAASQVVDAVRAAAIGEALISPALLGQLLPQLNRTYRSLGSDLTDREREILNLLASGGTNKAIAEELHLSVNTVRNYVQSVLTKLGAHSKLEAVSTAVREGVIAFPSRG